MRKIYILYIATISILSLVYINNTSALDYSSNVGIGFTFNPTLSINISSSDLVISNLKPGTTEDSNSINVSVATNAAYGYMLSATVGDNTHDNSNLTHSNITNVFSSIATNADLPSLTTDNTWGYNTSLDGGSTWSNYNGLSNSSNTTLLDKDSNISSSIDFRIGAKASSVQPSGTYTNTITFTAVTKPKPKEISDLEYLQDFAELDKTDLASVKSSMPMNSAFILKDERDEKEYAIARLADGKVWMTQNLDLCIGCTGVATLTSENTDLNEYGSVGYSNGYTNVNGVITWTPATTAITSNYLIVDSTVTSWVDSASIPYSAEGGDIYYYTNDLDEQYTPDIKYSSRNECINDGHAARECMHYHVGNYYNQTAAIASNNSYQLITKYTVAANSVCPVGWRLPKGATAAGYSADTHEFNQLFYTSGITVSLDSKQYNTEGFINLRRNPLYFVRGGHIYSEQLQAPGTAGRYVSSTVFNNLYFINMDFEKRWVGIADSGNRVAGLSVRCLAR